DRAAAGAFAALARASLQHGVGPLAARTVHATRFAGRAAGAVARARPVHRHRGHMSDSLVTGRASRDDCRPLGERLQKVGAGTLKASQVICDERLQRWIAAVLQLPAVGFELRKMAPPLLVLTVRCAQGELRVATSERALPLSAACALGLAD